MADREIRVKLTADGKQLQQELDKSSKDVEGFGAKLKSFAGAAVVGAVAAAVGVVASVLKGAIHEASQAEVQMGRLGVAVRNAGGDFGQLRPQLEQTVSSVMRMSTATDDDLREALTRMIAVSGDVAASQKNLSLVTDLAAFKQIDLADASDIVAKAMGGNTTALNKMGIAGKDSATVLENLRGVVGGFAEKESQTFSGSLTRIVNQWGEFKEAVGTALLSGGAMGSVADTLAGTLAKLAGWVEANEGSILVFTGALGDAVGALATVGKTVYDVVQPALGPVFKVTLGVLIGALNTASFVVKELAASFKVMAGGSLEALGWLVEKGGALLQLFGVQVVSEAGTSIRAFGAQLRTSAMADSKAAGAVYVQSMKDLIAGRVEGHKKLEQEEVAHGARLKTETDQQRKDRLAAEEEAQAKLADIYAKYNRLILEANDKLQQGLKKTGGSWDDIKRRVDIAYGSVLQITAGTGNLAAAAANAADENARMKREIDAAKQEMDHSVDSATSIGISLVSAANGMGKLSDAAATTLTSLINMGGAIAKFGIGSPEGVIAIVGGLAQLIGAWGSNPAETARKAAMAQNTEALRSLSKELGDFNVSSSGETFAGITAALGEITQSNEANGVGGFPTTAQVKQKLKEKGIAYADAKKLAERYGIDVEHDPQGWADLWFVLGNKQYGGAQGNFADELSAIQGSFDVLGISDADDRLMKLREFLQSRVPVLSEALAGDLSTKAGLDAAAQKLRDIYSDSIAGKLTPSQYGKANAGQLRSIIAALLPILGDADGVTTIPAVTPPPPGTGGTVPLGSVSTGSNVGGSLGAWVGVPVGLGGGVPAPSGVDAFAGLGASGGGTVINGGVNNYFYLPDIRDSQEAADAIAARVSSILGRSYSMQRSAMGLGS